MEHSQLFTWSDLVAYQDGSVVSRTVIDKPAGTVTVFAFDQGQGLSTHSAPFDALVHVVDGTVSITIDGKEYELSAPQSIIMPASRPHALSATKRFKMVLTMIKARQETAKSPPAGA